jgi:hypothetical protein
VKSISLIEQGVHNEQLSINIIWVRLKKNN